jgi:hypothetical protein
MLEPRRLSEECHGTRSIFGANKKSHREEIERYFSDCFEWCCTRFGVENILSADVHLDESTPHCHALIAPIQSGRWVGGMPINRTNTKVMNESFLKQVASVYGLKMGGKLTGKRKGEAVAKLLGHIENHDRGLFQSLLIQKIYYFQ